MEMKWILWIGLFLVIDLLFVNGVPKEKCEQCLPAEKCSFYGQLNGKEQKEWLERFQEQCSESHKNKISAVYGFSSNAKGDMVCCPNSIWGTEDQNNQNHPLNNDHGNLDINGPDYKQSNINNVNVTNRFYENPNNRKNFGRFNLGNNYRRPTFAPRQRNDYSMLSPIKQGFNPSDQNPYFQGVNDNRNTNGNAFGINKLGGQCPATSFPPNVQSGCCGREASLIDRVAAPKFNPNNGWNPRNSRSDLPAWPWKSPMDEYRNYGRHKRETGTRSHNSEEVTIDNRIAGGKETELEQYPWTVLLKTTFDYGRSIMAFNCGGSLISSRYVLTAGHCVVDEGATVKEVEIYLAEFDKRTFPRDCKIVLGEGERCIENIVMYAEEVIPHPNYDNTRLYNDIALIRIRGVAPYTDYIRPICLPPINIDEPDFSNLRLAVAGWGRNGKYKSDIKQSTVVNLVPQRQCKKHYPNLSKMQVCAAGYSGEDTCKGDSGGPLMMIYEGKYFVAGVVSGKRADAPCGTSVPSLYTNVYQYLQWILSYIRN